MKTSIFHVFFHFFVHYSNDFYVFLGGHWSQVLAFAHLYKECQSVDLNNQKLCLILAKATGHVTLVPQQTPNHAKASAKETRMNQDLLKMPRK